MVEETMDVSSDPIALAFDSREDMIECLDAISALGGLACEIVPWTLIIAPPSLRLLCEKKAIRARVLKVVPPAQLSASDREELMKHSVRVGTKLETRTRGE